MLRTISRFRRAFGGAHHESAHDSHGSHDSHDSHDSHEVSHGHHEHHPSKPLPEGAWPMHEDHYDPYYYYNKFGPFHVYTQLNTGRPYDNHNTIEEDPYRNEPHGYIFLSDPSDNRTDPSRGFIEVLFGLGFVMAAGFFIHFPNNDVGKYTSKKLADALITAQKIEHLLEQAGNESS